MFNLWVRKTHTHTHARTHTHTYTHTLLVQIGDKTLTAHSRTWPSHPWVHCGEPSSADLNIIGPQDPGNSEPLAVNQKEVMPRGPVSVLGFDMGEGDQG